METITDQCGYEDDLFVSEPQEYFHCAVCTLVLRDPVMILSCGHKYCQVCFRRMKTFSQEESTELRCPVDRKVVDLTDVREDIALRRVIGNLLVRCPRRDHGCAWTGDLREMSVHVERCRNRATGSNADGMSLSADLAKNLNERLEKFETALIEKDEDIVQLKRQQYLVRDHIRMVKQQQEQLKEENNSLKEKNVLLERKLSQLKKHHEQQLQWNEEMSKKVDSLLNCNKGMTLGAPDDKSVIVTTSTPPKTLTNQSVVERKKVAIRHHGGYYKKAFISNDEKFVQILHGEVTVSAPDAVVPPGSRVWYEVQCQGVVAWFCVGWTTADLPRLRTGHLVGCGEHSFGFSPFGALKYHNGTSQWGLKATGHESVIGVALDLVKGEISYSLDGQWIAPMGVAFSNIPLDCELFPAFSGFEARIIFNFGDHPFKYGPPNLGFKSLIDALAD